MNGHSCKVHNIICIHQFYKTNSNACSEAIKCLEERTLESSSRPLEYIPNSQFEDIKFIYLCFAYHSNIAGHSRTLYSPGIHTMMMYGQWASELLRMGSSINSNIVDDGRLNERRALEQYSLFKWLQVV